MIVSASAARAALAAVGEAPIEVGPGGAVVAILLVVVGFAVAIRGRR